ncbi:MAG: hypothetical protein ACUVWX_04200 [Kiritimatiellia bacterium]
MKAVRHRCIRVPVRASLREIEYRRFLRAAYKLFKRHPLYLPEAEGIACLELAHILPEVPETVIAIYIGVNDAVCNKGLITPFLVRHAHHAVFVFDPEVYPGGNAVPNGTRDIRRVVRGFRPPNSTWNRGWTYVIIEDQGRTPESLWRKKGYIDTIPAKFEDFTMLSALEESKVCFFVDPRAFDHPVNRARKYLAAARRRGEKMVSQFRVPRLLEGETAGLAPVVLARGEKLYIARPDYRPCEHAWSNLHPDNREWAVVNENSAIPLEFALAKPPVAAQYAPAYFRLKAAQT